MKNKTFDSIGGEQDEERGMLDENLECPQSEALPLSVFVCGWGDNTLLHLSLISCSDFLS